MNCWCSRCSPKPPPPGAGCASSLDFFPEKHFTYWKMNRPGAGGQTLFILGLKADPKARPVQARVVPILSGAGARSHGGAAGGTPGEGGGPDPSPPGEDEGGYQEPKGNVAPGSFAELRRLMPKAAQLLPRPGDRGLGGVRVQPV